MTSRRDFLVWFDDFYEVQMVGRVDPYFGLTQDQSATTADVVRACKRIKRDWSKYCGFIITVDPKQHDEYAQAVAHILGSIGKPVVVVTSAEDGEGTYKDISFKGRIINAVEVATADVSGVLILEDPFLYLANSASSGRLRKKAAGRMDFGFHRSGNAPERNADRPSLTTTGI
ncbi:MAG: hypothetical protein ABIG66_03275 [Candidatus Kerfeldbacteria bacterium]